MKGLARDEIISLNDLFHIFLTSVTLKRVVVYPYSSYSFTLFRNWI